MLSVLLLASCTAYQKVLDRTHPCWYETGSGSAGTLTQNDMQVVRMWIGGADFRELEQMQPPQPGQHRAAGACV